MKPPQTWSETVAIAKAVQEATDAAGIVLPEGKLKGQNLMVRINLPRGNGGQPFDAEGRRRSIRDPTSRRPGPARVT